MKVEITALKAPWPEGAEVGHVVELEGESIPGWALGKCKPVDAESTQDTGEGDLAAQLKLAGDRLEMVKKLAGAQIENLQAELSDLTAKLSAAQADNAALTSDKTDAENRVADLTAKLSAAEKAAVEVAANLAKKKN